MIIELSEDEASRWSKLGGLPVLIRRLSVPPEIRGFVYRSSDFIKDTPLGFPGYLLSCKEAFLRTSDGSILYKSDDFFGVKVDGKDPKWSPPRRLPNRLTRRKFLVEKMWVGEWDKIPMNILPLLTHLDSPPSGIVVVATGRPKNV